MKKSRKKRRKRKLTLPTIMGLVIGTGLIGIGLYHAVAHASAGAYFVILIGLLFNGVIFWIYKG